MTSERIDPEAREIIARIYGEPAIERTAMVYDLDADFAENYMDYVIKTMYQREMLPQKVREICAVAALTLVDKPDQLYVHVHAALRMGATTEEVLEAVLQMVVYGGFPATLTALKTYRRAIADFGLPAESTPAAKRASTDGLTFEERLQQRLDRGFKRGDSLFGKGVYAGFYQEMESWSPGFGRVALGFIGGGMYDRAVLDQKTRELVAVGACVVRNALPQLDAHTRAALQMGATRDEVMEVILQMSVYAGMPYMLQAARRFHAQATSNE